jgi:hypothetical protein
MHNIIHTLSKKENKKNKKNKKNKNEKEKKKKKKKTVLVNKSCRKILQKRCLNPTYFWNMAH